MWEHLPSLPEPAAVLQACCCHFAPAELRGVCTGAYNLAEGLADARLHGCLRN
jgi:hypothetical protein